MNRRRKEEDQSCYFNEVIPIGSRVRSFTTIAVFLLAALAFGAPTASADVALYAAASPVPDQSAKARDMALRQDLATVFVKVSGDPGAYRLPPLASAQALVLEYRYQQVPAAAGGGLALWARFDKDRVNAMLAAAGEPIWGENRPKVMAWVLAPEGIVGEDATNPVALALNAAASKRGLPLVLPLMDIADRQQVAASDIAQFSLAALEKDSERYGTQALLVGTIGTKKGGAVGSRWQLAFGGNLSPFSVPAPSPAAAAAAAVGKAADLLAQQFARMPGAGMVGVIALAVSGVGNLKAEVNLRRYVAGIEGVQQLRLARVAGNVLHFAVTYAGSAEDFARRLALSGFLVRDNAVAAQPPPAAAPAAGSTAQAALSFRYTP